MKVTNLSESDRKVLVYSEEKGEHIEFVDKYEEKEFEGAGKITILE